MKPRAVSVPEVWVTDGKRIRRGSIAGPVICTMGDPAQASLFEADAIEYADARLIVCLPRIIEALAECAHRLETCCHFSGSGAEYAHLAVKQYRDLIAEARKGRT